MDRRAEQLGLAMLILCSESAHRNRPLSFVARWVKPAVFHGQICFAFSSRGVPLACWFWALLAPDVERRLMKDGKARLHDSEWNEGDRFWLVDIIGKKEYLSDIVGYISKSQFSKLENTGLIRWSRDGTIRRLSSWGCYHGLQRRLRSRSNLYFHLPDTSFATSLTEWRDRERARLARLGWELADIS